DDARADSTLLRLLGDPDADIVQQAASCLGDREQTGAVSALGALLARDEQGVRYSAVRALARIGGPDAQAILRTHLPREHDAEIRAVIEQTLTGEGAP